MLQAELTLFSFMRDMNAWEARCVRRLNDCAEGHADFEVCKQEGQREYAAICDKYCVHDFVVQDGYSFSDPPDYDPDNEVVVSATAQSPGAVLITTQQEFGYRKRHKYLLILEGECWKIKRKQIEIETGEHFDDPL